MGWDCAAYQQVAIALGDRSLQRLDMHTITGCDTVLYHIQEGNVHCPQQAVTRWLTRIALRPWRGHNYTQWLNAWIQPDLSYVPSRRSKHHLWSHCLPHINTCSYTCFENTVKHYCGRRQISRVPHKSVWLSLVGSFSTACYLQWLPVDHQHLLTWWKL